MIFRVSFILNIPEVNTYLNVDLSANWESENKEIKVCPYVTQFISHPPKKNKIKLCDYTYFNTVTVVSDCTHIDGP